MNKPFTPLKVSGVVRSCPLEERRGEVLREGLNNGSESPTLSLLTRQLFQLLDSGVASVSDMPSGRAWPRPRVEGIRELVDRYDEDTCRLAATEAREIVQSQDRAPNITNLFAKKCADIAADIAADRESKRAEIRRALA